MTWPLAAVVLGGFGFLSVALWLTLPYLRKRGDEEKRIAALEAASVELNDRLARTEQVVEGGGILGRLPRAGVSR